MQKAMPINRIVLLSGLATVALAATGANVENPKTILFFGNSFTLGIGSTEAQNAGGVPGVVQALAAAAGHAAPHVENAAVSGQTLTWHLANNLAVIVSPQDFTPDPGFQWDVVVIQDFSTRPTHIGNLPLFRSDVVDIYAAVRAHSPDAAPVLYETWARGPGHSYYTGTDPEFPGGPAQMQQELRDGYAFARADVDAAFGPGTATVAPVGDAWENTGWNNLHAGDIYHANSRGTYLAALVIFGTIYRERTAGLPPILGSISTQEAAELQAFADAVIPDPCGFTGPDCNSNCIPDRREPDCNGNALADECDLAAGTSRDCNTNGTPDECEAILLTAWTDDFETDTSANWNVVAKDAGDTADFHVDYAALGIPPAPRSEPGATHGLYLVANSINGPADPSGVCAYPLDVSVSRDFVFRWDMYLRWAAPDSTEHACFGVLHDGTRLNGSAAVSSDTDGVFFAADGDGDVSTGSTALDGTIKDYNSYLGVPGSAAARQAIPQWDHTHALFQGLFPSVIDGVVGASVAGACGRQWVTGEIVQENGVITWKLNGATIASAPNTSGYAAGTVMLGLFDHFSGQNNSGHAYVIFDNVEIEIATAGVTGLAACLTGPCMNPPCYPDVPANCCLLDGDVDGDVDLHDYAGLQAAYQPPPPTLAFNPPAAAFSLFEGTDTDQTSLVMTTSDGGAPIITLTATEDGQEISPAWITIPATATPGASFDLTVDATGLAVGSYAAALIASAPGYEPANLPVTLSINPAPDDPTILIDFGSAAIQTAGEPRYWNNVHGNNWAAPVALANVAGAPAGVTLTITPGLGFNGANTSGTTSPPPGSAIALRDYPASAVQDSLFGNDVAFGAGVFPTAEIVLSGLLPGTTYDLTFCASRLGVGDIRTTDYAVVGTNSGLATLDASGNDSEVVTVAGILPDGSGEITITVDKGANNNNANGFYYLGVLEITVAAP